MVVTHPLTISSLLHCYFIISHITKLPSIPLRVLLLAAAAAPGTQRDLK